VKNYLEDKYDDIIISGGLILLQNSIGLISLIFGELRVYSRIEE